MAEFENFYKQRLEKFRKCNDRQAIALCPFHNDKKPSFSVNIDTGVWHCFACGKEGNIFSFVKEQNIPYPEIPNYQSYFKNKKSNNIEVEAVYPYKNKNGEIVYECVRYKYTNRTGKKIFFRRPDGKGGYIWNLDGIEKVLYRFPELLEAYDRDAPVFFVEGEKKVDALFGLGFTATCNPFGASNWKGIYWDCVGLDIVIMPDNDASGYKWLGKVANHIYGKANSVKVLQLPNLPYKGDIINWLKTGGTKGQLFEMVQNAPLWTPETANQFKPSYQKNNIENNKKYGIVPLWPFSSGLIAKLPASYGLVYAILAGYSNNDTRNTYITREKISYETGICLSSVSEITDKLAEQGLVIKKRNGFLMRYTTPLEAMKGNTTNTEIIKKAKKIVFRDIKTGMFMKKSDKVYPKNTDTAIRI